MKRKTWLTVFALVCALSCTLSFTACGGDNGGDNKTHTSHNWSTTYTQDGGRHYQTCDGCDEKKYSDHSYGTSGTCVCGKEKPASLTLAQFMSENSAIANMFVDDYIRPQAIVADDEDVKSEICTLVPSSSKEELHSVKFAYTTKIDDTQRAVKVTTATLKKDLLLEDIVKHYSSKSSLEKTLEADVDISTETIFEFDAKTNYAKQNIAEAVYNAYNTTSEVKLYNQQQSPTRKDYSLMTYLQKEGKTYTVHSFEVRNNENEETFISNINSDMFRRDKQIVSTHTLDGELLYDNGYTLEQFQEIPPVIEYEEKTITAEEITTALNENYKEAAVKSCFPSEFVYNENNVLNEKWYVTQNDKDQIVSANFAFNNVDEKGNAYFALTEVNFASPVDIKDLSEGNLPNATYNRLYRVNYKASIQETRKELTNAICNKVFDTNGTIENRYLIDIGASLEDPQVSGTVREFKVIEVTDKGVQEANVNIKTSDNDAGYIAKLESEENYRVFNQSSQNITGKEVEDVTILVEKQQTTKTASKAKATSARYVVTFGDSDEIMYI